MATLTTKQGLEVDLVLYKFGTCPFCQKVLRAVAALGIDLATRDTRQDPDAAATLVRVGGKQQVPCLFVDGEAKYESGDIVEWLQERFG